MEYITILGFVLVTTLLMTLIFRAHADQLNDAIVEHQVERIGEQITDTADAMYFIGDPSKTRLKLYYPPNVLNATANGRELVFWVQTAHGPDEVVKMAQVNMSGPVPSSPGVHFIQVQAQGAGVVLS